MRPEDRVLVLCARQTFGVAELGEVRELAAGFGPTIWARLLETAVAHRLAPLIYTNLRLATEVPEPYATEFEREKVTTLIVKAERRETLRAFLSELDALEIPALLIKGEALDATIYDEPWYTASADIDVVLMRRRVDVPAAVLDRLGSLLPTVPFIETNWLDHHDITLNGILPVDFERVARDAETIDLAGRPTRIPSAEDALLFAAINSVRKKFFRLKSLCDLSELIRRRPEIDWTAVAERAHAYRCAPIVYTALYVVDRLMDCRLPERALGALRVGRVRGTIVRFLANRFSFSSLYDMRGGLKNRAHRFKGAAVLLPYASYSIPQAVRSALRR